MTSKYTIQNCTLIDVTTFTDERGSLSVLENGQPFVPKRVFWMHHIAAGAERGAHAMVSGSEMVANLMQVFYMGHQYGYSLEVGESKIQSYR